MIKVKICGITREIDMSFAILSGADAVGFIVGFPSSPRNLTMGQAAALARKVPPLVDAVLVSTPEAIAADPSLGGAKFDAIQVYGEVLDPDALRRSTGAKLIRAYSAKSDDLEVAKNAAKGFDAILTDTYVEGVAGGTGMASDWILCKKIKTAVSPIPLILSGGLNPGNVAAAINVVKPYAVDVSSGVEASPGVKDPGKMIEFIQKAKVAGW